MGASTGMVDYGALHALISRVMKELEHDLKVSPRPAIVEAVVALAESWEDKPPTPEAARPSLRAPVPRQSGPGRFALVRV